MASELLEALSARFDNQEITEEEAHTLLVEIYKNHYPREHVGGCFQLFGTKSDNDAAAERVEAQGDRRVTIDDLVEVLNLCDYCEIMSVGW